jgi:hypothetical protein
MPSPTDDIARSLREKHRFREVSREEYFAYLDPKNPDGHDIEFVGDNKRYSVGVLRAGSSAICGRICDLYMIEPCRYFIP